MGNDSSRIDVTVLAAVSLFASKDETRYYINGVCVEIAPRSVTYVATDGHRLVAYRDTLFDDTNENGFLGTFIIPTEHCRVFKCRKDGIPAASMTRGDGKSITIEFDGVGLTFEPIGGTFPDWRRVPPAAVTGNPGQFNLAYLADFQKFAKAMDLPPPHVCHNGDGPTPIFFQGRHEHIAAVLMPMRTVAPGLSIIPPWAIAPPQAEAA